MKTVASIKNNKIHDPVPQYHILQQGETVGYVVRVCAHIPRKNFSNGQNRWDILVHVHAPDLQDEVTVEQDASGTTVGRYDGVDIRIRAYITHTNELGSKDREYLDIVPSDSLDPELAPDVKQHLESTWGFVNDDDGNRRQIAIFPWPTEKKPRW